MSESWWYLSDVVRRHNQSTYEKSGLCSPRPCCCGEYICEYCGRRFSKYANCLAHEKFCADWELVSLPCNEESYKLTGCRPRCEDTCFQNEHCDSAFVIWRNKRTGEFAWERP